MIFCSQLFILLWRALNFELERTEVDEGSHSWLQGFEMTASLSAISQWQDLAVLLLP